MVGSRARTPARKRPGRYHHGDLRRALVEQAVRTIQARGVEHVTLRAAGKSLGVSRTALYRHFADKSSLLAAVASAGFRMLRLELVSAWEGGGRGREAFDAMGVAYVRFALAHPSHYRVMFGAFLDADPGNAELAEEGAGAFQVLVDALVAQQQAGLVRQDEPQQLARFVWAAVHGAAMLAIDGRLQCHNAELDALIHFSIERIRSGIAAADAHD